MNAQDYRQVYRVVNRAVSELHGIVNRLRDERDPEAAVIVEGAIDDLNRALHVALQLWRSQQEQQETAR